MVDVLVVRIVAMYQKSQSTSFYFVQELRYSPEGKRLQRVLMALLIICSLAKISVMIAGVILEHRE